MTVQNAQSVQTPGGRLEPGTTEPVDASTVLLVRDGAAGLEVFLLQRHLQSDFAGGAFAFPGGKVDAGDRYLDPSRWDGLEPARVRDRVGARSDADALGLWVAAVRETFEEAGVLLARRDGRPVTAEDLESPSFQDARQRLATRGEHWDWRSWLDEEDLVLDLAALVPLSWWVTPHGMHKRFDTRFFVTEVPGGQLAAHDDIETTDSLWSTPADALAAAEQGRAVVIFPTRKNLEALLPHGSAADALAAVRRAPTLRKVLPALQVVDGLITVRHPDGGPPESI
jgi:8-oxo-dGTP pyrophosphatase MutT (NUDIX family)